MLSWIFTRKSLRTKKKHESIKRVQNMLLTPTRNVDKFFSPTLQQLQCGDIKHVKKISSIYENNIAQENEKALGNRLSVPTPLTSRKLVPAFEKNDEQSDSELLDLFRSFSKKDKIYTDGMKKLIDSYIFELEFEARFMSEDDINELTESIFGNIKEIYEMHIIEFQPFIEACANDRTSDVSTQIFNFADKLATLCENKALKPYLTYALEQKDTKSKRDSPYANLMRYAEQKYQFSYDFDPINQITHYGYLVEEIFNEAQKQTITFKCSQKLTHAKKEFIKEMAKIKLACSKK